MKLFGIGDFTIAMTLYNNGGGGVPESGSSAAKSPSTNGDAALGGDG